MTLPLADLPLVWRLYALATFAAALIVILLNLIYVLPELARESWDWIHDALRPAPPKVVDITSRRRHLNACIAAGRRPQE